MRYWLDKPATTRLNPTPKGGIPEDASKVSSEKNRVVIITIMKNRFFRYKLKRIEFIACLTVVAGSVMTGSTVAATVGSLGATSSGTSVINLDKQEVVVATDISDLHMGLAGSLNSTVTASDDVCVYTSTGAYSLNISSSNGSFYLSDDNATTDIPYSVGWGTDSSNDVVAYNTDISGLLGDSRSINCNELPNALLSISVTAPDFNAADPGNYTDTLTLNFRAE